MILFTDGGSRGNPGEAACAYFIMDANNQLVDFGGKYLGTCTNNVAEYKGLIEGLSLAKKNKISQLEVRMDSELIVKQINGEYKISNSDMQNLSKQVKELSKSFESIIFVHVRREQNKFADKQVNIILDLMKKTF
jgi:ribonuclease HI